VKRSRPYREFSVVFSAACILLFISSDLGAQAPGQAGQSKVHFPTSCAASVQPEFDRAVELLHSFEYPESERVFHAVLEADPDCDMARWGIAINQWHQIWAPPSEAELALGAEMLTQIDPEELTEFERGFIVAASSFFTDYDSMSHNQRAKAYSAKMEQVYQANRENAEAVAFYALSLLATADPADKTYCLQFRSAGLLNGLLAGDPDHPGGLHYLIHSYDYPGLAYLALPAAETYAEVAPDSAHAQHMPSHIFTRLGLWNRSIASNLDSTASATDYTERAHLPGHYDEGIHSTDYLVYAYLQVARDQEALDVIEQLRQLGPAHPQNFKVAYTYASSPARYALERQQWAEAADLELLSEEFPWDQFPWAVSINYFARGIGAARSGDIESAEEALNAIRAIEEGLPAETLKYWSEEVSVHAEAVASWIALARGETEVALELALAAAERENAVDKHPVTPGEVLPAQELLADMLLEVNRPADARQAYNVVLEGSPNRLNALLGAAEASARMGDNAVALAFYDTALQQASAGNMERPRLRQAMEFVAAAQGVSE
jgi:tetratricopeptide (TPR) repeat protein